MPKQTPFQSAVDRITEKFVDKLCRALVNAQFAFETKSAAPPTRARRARRVPATVVTDPELLLAACGPPPEENLASRVKKESAFLVVGSTPAAAAAERSQEPTLRDGEVALHTAKGGVVIRRRKGAAVRAA